MIEVLERPVAAVQTLRLPTGHAVRADMAGLKSAFLITHVRSEGRRGESKAVRGSVLRAAGNNEEMAQFSGYSGHSFRPL